MKEKNFIEIIRSNDGIINNIIIMYCDNNADRDDLRQEILAQLWKAIPKFRGDSKISTWIYRVALNVAISDFRKRKREPATLNTQNIYPDVPDSGTGKTEDEIILLHRAIEKLTRVERAMVLLYLESQPYEDISEIMGITPNHARVKMHRIKDKLKVIFKELTDG